MEGPTWRSCRPPAKLPGPVGSAFQFTGLPMLLSVPVILRFPLFEVALGSDALFLPISLVPAHPGTRPLRGAWSAALAPGPPPSLGALAPDVWAMPPQDSLPGLPLQSSHCTRCSLCYLLGPLPKGRSANFCCSGGRGGVSQEAIHKGCCCVSLCQPADVRREMVTACVPVRPWTLAPPLLTLLPGVHRAQGQLY